MNFFEHFDVIDLCLLALFPRLSLLFMSIASGGLLWWLGWFFTPHLLVAILSLPYYDQNPALVVIAWIIGINATFGEGSVARKRARRLYDDE